MDKTPFIITSLLIALGAIVNLVRFFWDIPAHIGTITLPGWTGGILFIILGLLAIWSFRVLWTSPPSNR